MTYAIRLPDGSLVQNIPDEVTPEEAKRQLIAAMPELASKERTWGQAASDIGAALVSGAGAAAQFPGQLVGLLPGMRGLGETLAAPGEKLAEYGKSLKSEGLKAREALRNKALSEAEKDGVLAEFATAIKSTITDPALLSTFLTEQLPQLVGPGGAAKLTTMLGRGAVKAAATEEAAKEAAKALGTRATTAAIGTGAAMQGADIGDETYKEAYKLAIAKGASEEEARSIALAKARVAALEAGALSIGAQRLPGGRAIERRLAGLPGEGRIRGALGEAVSEMVEEGGGAFAKNIGLQEIDPTRSLTAGIGTAAGLGAIGGAGLGAVTGARPRTETPAGEAAEAPIDVRRRELAQEAAAKEAEEAEKAAAVAIPPLPETYPELIQFTEQVKQLPKSKERTEALKAAREKRLSIITEEVETGRLDAERAKEFLTAEEAATAEVTPRGGLEAPATTEEIPEPTVRGEAPTEPTTVLDAKAIAAIGFAPNKGAKSIHQQLLGKDISNPEDAQTIRTVLEKYKESKNASEKTVAKIDAFLTKLPEPQAPPEVPSVPPVSTGPEASGAGAPVVSEPGAGAAPAGVGITEPTGVVRTEPNVEQPAGGEGAAPPAVTPTAPLVSQEEIDKRLDAMVESGQITEEQAQDYRTEFMEAAEPAPTAMGAALQAQIDEIKAKMDALRTKSGRLPAAKSPARNQYDALKAQLETLVPPEKGALKERLEQAGATGVFAVRDGKPILDLPAVQDALKNRNPKMFKAVLAYIGVDEDGNYLPTTYSADEAAQSVGLAKSSGANVRRTAEALGLTADVISRFQASQTGVIGIAKNVSEASLSGISVESPKAGILYEPGKKGKDPKVQKFLLPALNDKGVLDFTKPDNRQLADIYSRASRYDAKDNGAVMQQLNAEVEARRAADRRGMDAAINRAYGKLVEEEEAQSVEQTEDENIEPITSEEVEDTTARLSDEDFTAESKGSEFYPEVPIDQKKQIEEKIRGSSIPQLADYLVELFRPGDQKLIAQAAARRIRAMQAAGVKFEPVVVVNQGTRAPSAIAVGSARGLASVTFDKGTGVPTISVYIRGSDLDNSGLDPRTILHEVIHAATIAALQLGSRRGAVGSNVARLRKDLLDLSNAVVSHFNNRVKSGDKLTEFEQAIYDRQINAFADEHEVLAWGLTSPAAQQYLETIPYQGRTAWTKFVDSIRSFLGLPAKANTALSELLHLSEEIFESDATEDVVLGKTIFGAAPPAPATKAAQMTPAQVQAQPIGEKEDTGFTGYLDRKFGSAKIIGFRARVADSLAAVDAFFADKYNGKIKDNTGNANPIVLLSRALDSMRFSKVAQEVGTLKRDPEGLIVADKLIASNEFGLIKGEEVSYLKALQELKRYGLSKEEVGKILIGHREHGLRELVRAKKSDYAQTMTDAQIDAYERRFQSDQRIQRISQMLDAVRFSMIDLMVETGRIDAAKAAEWKDATGYIPFSRIDSLDNFYDPSVPGKRGAAVYRNMRELSGDPTRRLENPLDTFSGLIDWMTKESMTNDASSRALTEMSMFNAAELIPARESKSNNQQGAIVEAYVGGAKKLFYVPDPALLGAFSYTPPVVSSVLKSMQKGSRVLRAGVTSMPPFVVKQVFDDITRMYAFAGLDNNLAAVKRVAVEFPKLWFSEVFGKSSKLMQDMEKRGLIGTFDFTEQGNVKNIMAEAGVEKRSIGSRMLQIMEAGAKASDLAVRNAIYEQVLKETGSKAEAENRAREIINFSRRGNAKIMDTMIRVVPFFNAFARGTDKLLVAAAGGKLGVGQSIGQPRAIFWKRMGTLAAMATVYALLMSDDDEYNKLPDRVRDRNIIIPLNKEFVQKYGVLPGIPLPADLAFIFKAIPERIIQYYRLQGTPEERSMLEITRELVKQGYDVFSTPNITPQVLRPILENITNYSTFLDRPLESQAQQNLRPFERYGMGTSEVAKRAAAFGEDIAVSTGVEAFAVSPIKLENFIRGMLGTIGGTVLAVGDALINPTRTDRPLQNQLLPQLTGASTLMKDAVGSRFIDEMYRLDREAEQVHNTYKRLHDRDPDSAERFLLEHYGLYTMRNNIKGIMQGIQTATKTALAVDQMPDLSPEDRRDMINMLRRDQTLLARQAYEVRRLVNAAQMDIDKQMRR